MSSDQAPTSLFMLNSWPSRLWPIRVARWDFSEVLVHEYTALLSGNERSIRFWDRQCANLDAEHEESSSNNNNENEESSSNNNND